MENGAFPRRPYCCWQDDVLKVWATSSNDSGVSWVVETAGGRIGNGYTLGGRQFIDRFKVGLFVPMHFVASGFDSAWRFREFAEAKGIDFWPIAHEGEFIEQ